MHTRFLVAGTLPDDSPLRRLAGHTITLPAANPAAAERRATELRQAGADPVIWQVRPEPWVWIAWGLTAAVVASVLTAVAAILADRTGAAWAAAGAMVAFGLALFPALAHLEMES